MSRYLPEVHDVHPGTAAGTQTLLDLLSPSARRCAAILVVPHWSHSHLVDANTTLAHTLRDHVDQIVLHGLTHAAPPTWWSRVWAGPRNDAEFARAGIGEAAAWLQTGASALALAVGRRPTWFCAPRWAQSASTTTALRQSGFAGWMLRDRLVRASGYETPLPAVWFDDGEQPWVQRAARRWRAHRISRLQAARQPFRLALHPRDLSAPDVLDEIRSLLGRLESGGWMPVTLDEAARPRSDAIRGAVRP